MIFSQNVLISFDPVMQKLLKEIETIGEMNLLIEGESGVGKTPVAKYSNTTLSKNGKIRPFVRINCAGLNRERLQDEMFGHKRGAYTGAESDRVGHVELAQEGDLFLDEIAEMDLQCQAELLTFLDSGEYRRLGDNIIKSSTCRIISATNRNLKSMVDNGFFRKDLFSRIAQCKIFIPPLRERKNDIKPIMEHYINNHLGYLKPYSKYVLELYQKLDWKDGNIRQLRDAVSYMCNRSSGCDEINLCHINPQLYDPNIEIKDSSLIKNTNLRFDITNFGFSEYMEHLEYFLLLELIKDEKSMRALAKKIKIPHTTLQRKLKKHNIKFSG